MGIVLGTVFLLALPTSALVSTLIPPGEHTLAVVVAWVVPGLVAGPLLAYRRLPVSYHEVWRFSLSSWIAALLGWSALGVETPAVDLAPAIAVWLAGLGVGAQVARPGWPLTRARGRGA